MGKKILPSFIACFLLVGALKAQYVNIPDPNFQIWLSTSSVSSCLNGVEQLDTTCTALQEDTIVVCSNSQITNLEGIEYFKNLRYLDCSINLLDSLPIPSNSLRFLNCCNNSLAFLPILPNGIRVLYCESDQLRSLPTLPDSLTSLYCGGNLLDSLPTLPGNLDSLVCAGNVLTKLPVLPNSLQVLMCMQNQLTILPHSSSLKYIDCSYNAITTLGALDSIQSLICQFNQLTSLFLLPTSLVYLQCRYNNIDTIAAWPDHLIFLDCGENQLKSLGNHLPDSLEYLGCYHNLLTNLPPLPATLIDIACEDNLLIELPSLPDSMQLLGCQGNPNLQCLPELTIIYYLRFDSTAVTCLPNYGNVTNSTPLLSSLPLCESNNPKGCPVYASIPEIKELNFSIYPNPANDYTLLTLNNAEGEFTITVFDITGREVMSNTTSSSSYQLPVSQLIDGLYFVTVNDSLGAIGVGKLVVVR